MPLLLLLRRPLLLPLLSTITLMSTSATATATIAPPMPTTVVEMADQQTAERDIWSQWVFTSWSHVGMVVLSTIVVYITIITLTRFSGLRSFSTMSAFDFTMTVAIGSLTASSIATKNPSLLLAVVAFAGLYLMQTSVAVIRQRSGRLKNLVDNSPLLLMDGSSVLHENLSRARVTESDLRAKLREHNVLHLDQVQAVVFETTGTLSVMKTDDPDTEFDRSTLLQGVRGADQDINDQSQS
ncbi:MAG: DUF421 domain-containing protein [Planctomycetota bacterium]